ncbi:hypothetical protein N431DRAFT_453728 [Stipitochalara longipes BDJ]|nr:hypothetical protein N431DRAFT_453728 [Stipitochalara longipes BDJ]
MGGDEIKRFEIKRTINLVSGAASTTESVHEATIENLGYKSTASGHEYNLIYSSYTGRSRYTVRVDGPSAYTIKKHISSSPISSITFSIEIVGGKCMIRRDYGASSNVTTHYSILKTEGGWALGCCHDGVLSKLRGYTQYKLDTDACQAYNAGFFIMKLEEMADAEWIKVDE